MTLNSTSRHNILTAVYFVNDLDMDGMMVYAHLLSDLQQSQRKSQQPSRHSYFFID